MTDIKKIKCFLLDMDGTLYLGEDLIDGSLEFLNILRRQGKDFLFLTNNSSKNKTEYQKKLARMGCEVDEEKVFTSGEATTIYLNTIAPKAKVFLLGTKFLEDEFKKAEFVLVNETDEIPEYVVLGFDTTLTYDKLWKACDFIRDGIPYIATHPDFNCPLEGGKFMPDIGAMIEFIAGSTGKRPYVVGKPNKDIVDAICNKYNYEKDQLAMVGDRLYTDIKTGTNSGIVSILVLSGETSIEDYEASDVEATYVYSSLKEIGEDIDVY